MPLHKGHLVQPEQYPRLTLLGQALGAVALGYEALSHAVPEVSSNTPQVLPMSWLHMHHSIDCIDCIIYRLSDVATVLAMLVQHLHACRP